MVDVAIIGAGVGGLTAAIDLAARGYAVTVFEAHAEVGGKLGRTVVGGIEADTGPSVLTMPDVFEDLFRHAGSCLTDELALIRHDELAELRWADGTHVVLHGELDATLASVSSSLGPAAAAELEAFLAYAGAIWEAAAPSFVYGDAPSIGSALSLGLRSPLAFARIDPMRTMLAGIDAHVREPHLRAMLARYATYNGSDARCAPATLNCIAHVELSMGSYGIRGGMYELARALERVARRWGVQFRMSCPVRAIERINGRVTGLRTGEATTAFDAVVANVDVAHLFTDLLDDPTSDAAQSMSGWTALIRTARASRLPHSVLFGDVYEREFADIFDHGLVPRDPTIYVCAQEPAHARIGAERHELLFCMANAPATSADRGSDINALRDMILSRLRGCGWIDASAEVAWERAPTDLAAQYPRSDGAIYGASSNSRLAAFRRPANRVSAVPGLYLASGSAHPGGGVPLCALSGRAAARALAADFVLRASPPSGKPP